VKLSQRNNINEIPVYQNEHHSSFLAFHFYFYFYFLFLWASEIALINKRKDNTIRGGEAPNTDFNTNITVQNKT
jgi:hypothetical protein